MRSPTELLNRVGLAIGTEARGVHNSLKDQSAAAGGETGAGGHTHAASRQGHASACAARSAGGASGGAAEPLAGDFSAAPHHRHDRRSSPPFSRPHRAH